MFLVRGGHVFAVVPSHRGCPSGPMPAIWQLALAFAVVYLGYGLNFLAVKIGVETLPAFLFAASHVFAAGAVLGLWQVATGRSFRFTPWGMARGGLAAFFLFVGGVGLVTEGEKLGVASGIAAIIKASVPLWVAVIEGLRPGGEKPKGLAVVGLCVGAIGVIWLIIPRLEPHDQNATEPVGIALLMLSALLFAVGSVLVRHAPPSRNAFANSALMMVIGGIYLAVLGLSMGEASQVTPADFTAGAFAAFGFLFLVHSLLAFSAMNWLLSHIPASIVTTKFYVSPLIAVMAGFLVLGEEVGISTIGALLLVLGGVGLAMYAEIRQKATPALDTRDEDEVQE